VRAAVTDSKTLGSLFRGTTAHVPIRVTLNNASDYRTNGHYRTPNPT